MLQNYERNKSPVTITFQRCIICDEEIYRVPTFPQQVDPYDMLPEEEQMTTRSHKVDVRYSASLHVIDFFSFIFCQLSQLQWKTQVNVHIIFVVTAVSGTHIVVVFLALSLSPSLPHYVEPRSFVSIRTNVTSTLTFDF